MVGVALARKFTPLEDDAEGVISMLIERRTLADIARHYGTTANGVWLFKERHAAEIESARALVAKSVTDYAIADKAERIAGLQAIADQLTTEIATNGAIDRNAVTGQRSTPVVRELRATYRDAAEQLGQLPRPEVNVQNNIVLIRQVSGVASTDDELP